MSTTAPKTTAPKTTAPKTTIPYMRIRKLEFEGVPLRILCLWEEIRK